MNKEKLDKINGMVGSISKMEEVLAIEGQQVRISDHSKLVPRGTGCAVMIDRSLLADALTAHIGKLKAELKELGYEDD